MNSVFFASASKAERLATLTSNLACLFTPTQSALKIPNLVYFNRIEWEKNADSIVHSLLDEAKTRFRSKTLAVRSSAHVEDHWQQSYAGAYLSRLNVPFEFNVLRTNIEMVLAAMPQHPRDQVLVQEMVSNARYAGVAASHSLKDYLAYYTIAFTEGSDTTQVTAGTGATTHWLFPHTIELSLLPAAIPNWAKCLLVFLQRGLATWQDIPFEIEFAIDQVETVWLLQIRPLAQSCLPENLLRSSLVPCSVTTTRQNAQETVKQLLAVSPHLSGQNNLLGTMPDWNPIETLGLYPRPLAWSLYEALISRRAWRVGRYNLGYQRLPDLPLVHLVAGQPYVDIRASANSLLPATLPSGSRAVWIDAWLTRLSQYPELHDKVEFMVYLSSYHLDTATQLEDWYRPIAAKRLREELKQALHQQTQVLLNLERDGHLARAERKIDQLTLWLQQNPAPQISSESWKIWLHQSLAVLEDLGTTPFVELARHAFIAESWLRSLIHQDCLTMERLTLWRHQLNTVTQALVTTCAELQTGKTDFTTWQEQFGHLRPGTYDIRVLPYAKTALSSSTHRTTPSKIPDERDSQLQELFVLSSQEKNKITQALHDHGFRDFNADQLFQYARRAIKGREYAKFTFSKLLSTWLETLADWGESHRFSREDLSWWSLNEVLRETSSDQISRPRIAKHRQQAQTEDQAHRAIKLGPLIQDSNALNWVVIPPAVPNFVGHRCVEGSPILLSPATNPGSLTTSQAIICIVCADPGYDWIFSHPHRLAGLITAYGGSYSHLAVRCAELGIPAAIGVGEGRFHQLLQAVRIRIDPIAEQILPFLSA